MRSVCVVASLVCVLALAGHAGAQIQLQVKSTGTQAYDADNQEGVLRTGPKVPPRRIERAPHSATQKHSIKMTHEVLTVQLRNPLATEQQPVLEWYFFSQPLSGTEAPRLNGSGSQEIRLPAGATTSLRISSPLYPRYETALIAPPGGGDRPGPVKSATGEKSAGYVVRVLSNGKLIALEASSADLKRDYATVPAPQ